MPAPRRAEYDSQEFKRLYLSSMTLDEIGELYGVSNVAVCRAALRRGFEMRKTGWREIGKDE